MRLRTENIHEYRLKCNTVAQITLDDDFNVPDTKDDIELIVKEWGNVQTDSVKVNKDKAAVGITYLCNFSSLVCKDAGFGAVAGQIEVFGKISVLLMGLPVLATVIENIGALSVG